MATSFFYIYVMTTSFFYIYVMATSFFYIYVMFTSFFYIYVMATSFFYIYIDIYKLTERPVVLLDAIFDVAQFAHWVQRSVLPSHKWRSYFQIKGQQCRCHS